MLIAVGIQILLAAIFLFVPNNYLNEYLLPGNPWMHLDSRGELLNDNLSLTGMIFLSLFVFSVFLFGYSFYKKYKTKQGWVKFVVSSLVLSIIFSIFTHFNLQTINWYFNGGWKEAFQDLQREHFIDISEQVGKEAQDLIKYKLSLIKSENREEIAGLPYFYDRHEVLIGIAVKNDDIAVCDEFENFGQSVINKARCRTHVLACDQRKLSDTNYNEEELSRYDEKDYEGGVADRYSLYKEGVYSCSDIVPGSRKF